MEDSEEELDVSSKIFAFFKQWG